MANPNLMELAAKIADYMVINEHPLEDITIKDENGDIVYTDECQETFNEHYDYVLDLLESASLRVKNELEVLT
tara:strand:+ start:224 stop:442 length:219 start_codon:yes stop_codon:yes gene_type:complete